jgi:hypothetical protein
MATLGNGKAVVGGTLEQPFKLGATKGMRKGDRGHPKPHSEWRGPRVLKYSLPQPNKEDWDGADHLARFYLNIKNMNLRSREGIFYGKNLSDDTMDKIVWALKGWLCKIHAPSYINKPHGGTTILGTKRKGYVL